MLRMSVLVCLMATIQIVSAHLSNEIKEHMKKLANAEIAKQLVNGSNDKSANQSEALKKSFIKVVQSG